MKKSLPPQEKVEMTPLVENAQENSPAIEKEEEVQ